MIFDIWNYHCILTEGFESACLRPSSKQMFEVSLLLNLKRGGRITMCASSSDSTRSVGLSGEKGRSDVQIIRSGGVEPLRGKSGSVSFYGLTHQLVEEGKLESAPFVEDKGSFLWLLAPVALISSLILPQFFVSNAIEAFVKNETLLGKERNSNELYDVLSLCYAVASFTLNSLFLCFSHDLISGRYQGDQISWLGSDPEP